MKQKRFILATRTLVFGCLVISSSCSDRTKETQHEANSEKSFQLTLSISNTTDFKEFLECAARLAKHSSIDIQFPTLHGKGRNQMTVSSSLKYEFPGEPLRFLIKENAIISSPGPGQEILEEAEFKYRLESLADLAKTHKQHLNHPILFSDENVSGQRGLWFLQKFADVGVKHVLLP